MEELLKLLETRNCELSPIYEHQNCIGLAIYSDIELDSDYLVFCDYKVAPWIIKGKYNVNPEKNINPEIGRNCEVENVRFEDGETDKTYPITSEKAIAFIEKCIDEYYLHSDDNPWD